MFCAGEPFAAFQELSGERVIRFPSECTGMIEQGHDLLKRKEKVVHGGFLVEQGPFMVGFSG